MPFELRQVGFRYPATGTGIYVEALSIPHTGITAILGKSGSGKTTLLSILAGFVTPQLGETGSFTFGGRPAEDLLQGGRVGFVFQTPMLLGAATGYVNLLQGRVATVERPGELPLTEAELVDRLRELDLFEDNKALLGKRARQFSGGEAQRFAVLRAVLRDPDVILCDEPTSSLDRVNARRVMDTLKRWSERTGKAVIWVTHDLALAGEYVESSEHCRIVIDGELHEPQAATRAVLDDRHAEPADKSEALTDLFGGEDIVTLPIGPSPAGYDRLRNIVPGRWRYATWIANALSTDTRQMGKERSQPAELAPDPVRQILGKFQDRPVTQTHWRWAKRLAAYSRKGLVLVLFVLMAQIAAALCLGGLAADYADTRLRDPSVARIAFERSDLNSATLFMRDTNAPPPLTPVAIRDLEGAIRDALPETIAADDRARVAVMGRWSVQQSRIGFDPGPNADERCTPWLVALPTVAVAADDPILRQASLRSLGGEATGAPLPRFEDTTRPAIFIQERMWQRIRGLCDLSEGPQRGRWTVGLKDDAPPVAVDVIATFERPPPLQPYFPSVILSQDMYAAEKVTRQKGRIDPPVYANAYIPLDGFAAAIAVLEEAGYTVRDDSAAAVKQLRLVADLADTAPLILIVINVIACAVLVVLVTDALLELNRRVLALFVAHGFGLRDILLALLIHFLPAPIYATGVLIVGAFGLAAVIVGLLPPDLAHLPSLITGSLVATFVITALIILLALSGMVWLWWTRTQSQLKAYLQD